MMRAKMIEDSEGVRAARAQKRRYWWTAALSMLGAVGVGAILTMGTISPGRMSPGWAIASVIAMAVVVVLAVHFTNRVTDEVEHQHMLKANSFGLYFYFLGQFSWMILSTAGLVPPPDAWLMYVATGLATLARYGMLKIAR